MFAPLDSATARRMTEKGARLSFPSPSCAQSQDPNRSINNRHLHLIFALLASLGSVCAQPAAPPVLSRYPRDSFQYVLSQVRAVETSKGRVVIRDKRLYIRNSARSGETAMRIPDSLRQAMDQSAELLFASARSMKTDGREYILLIIGQLSAPYNKMGYCGAGMEYNLHAIDIAPKIAKPGFEKLVDSCIYSLNLAGNHPVSFQRNPAAIIIKWEYDSGKNGGATETYRDVNGKFVKSE